MDDFIGFIHTPGDTQHGQKRPQSLPLLNHFGDCNRKGCLWDRASRPNHLHRKYILHLWYTPLNFPVEGHKLYPSVADGRAHLLHRSSTAATSLVERCTAMVKKGTTYTRQCNSLGEDLRNCIRKFFFVFSVCRELQSPDRPLVLDLWGCFRWKRSNELNFPGFAAVPLWAKGHLTGVNSPRSDTDTEHNRKPRDIFMMYWSIRLVTIWKWKIAGHYTLVCCTLTLKQIQLNCVLKSLISRANREAAWG